MEHCWYKSGVSEQEFYVKGQVENQELASLVSAMRGIWIPGGFLRVDQRQLVRTVDQRRSYAHTDTQVVPGWFVPTCRQYWQVNGITNNSVIGNKALKPIK